MHIFLKKLLTLLRCLYLKSLNTIYNSLNPRILRHFEFKKPNLSQRRLKVSYDQRLKDYDRNSNYFEYEV